MLVPIDVCITGGMCTCMCMRVCVCVRVAVCVCVGRQVSVVQVAGPAADVVGQDVAPLFSATTAALFVFNRCVPVAVWLCAVVPSCLTHVHRVVVSSCLRVCGYVCGGGPVTRTPRSDSGELLERRLSARGGFAPRPRCNNRGAIALCASTGRSVHVADAASDARFDAAADAMPAGAGSSGQTYVPASLLCVPVLVRLGSVAGLEGVALDSGDEASVAAVSPRAGAGAGGATRGASASASELPPRTVAGVLAVATSGVPGGASSSAAAAAGTAGRGFDADAERLAFVVAQMVGASLERRIAAVHGVLCEDELRRTSALAAALDAVVAPHRPAPLLRAASSAASHLLGAAHARVYAVRGPHAGGGAEADAEASAAFGGDGAARAEFWPRGGGRVRHPPPFKVYSSDRGTCSVAVPCVAVLCVCVAVLCVFVFVAVLCGCAVCCCAVCLCGCAVCVCSCAVWLCCVTAASAPK